MSPSSRPLVGTPKWLCVFLMILGFIGTAVPGMAQSATFISTDTATSGNWKGVYGQDGYVIPGDSNVLPGYDSTLTTTGTSYTWFASSADPRALLKGASLTDRIASAYYDNNSFTIDVNLSDGLTHQVTLYAL